MVGHTPPPLLPHDQRIRCVCDGDDDDEDEDDEDDEDDEEEDDVLVCSPMFFPVLTYCMWTACV